MALLAVYGAGPPFLLTQLHMATLALPVKGIFNIQAVALMKQAMASLAFLHRLPLPPDIAPALIVVVTLGAAYPAFLVEAVAEPHRGLFPRALESNGEPTG
jgi:hypothetical protein